MPVWLGRVSTRWEKATWGSTTWDRYEPFGEWYEDKCKGPDNDRNAL